MSTTIEFLKEYNDLEPQFGKVEITFEGLCKMLDAFHTSKCEEAGKELPDNDKIFENARNHFLGGVATDRNFDCYVSGQKDMRRQASKLLASKESQLLQLGMDGQVMQGEHEQIVESLNSKLEAKDKEIEEWKEAHKGTSAMLQGVKAEVEKLKTIPEVCLCKCSDKQLLRTVYPLPDICEYCCKAVPKFQKRKPYLAFSKTSLNRK